MSESKHREVRITGLGVTGEVGEIGVMQKLLGPLRRGLTSKRLKPSFERSEGTKFSAVTGNKVFFFSLLDRAKDTYQKFVYDLREKRTIKYQEEKASEHRGYGSDKRP